MPEPEVLRAILFADISGSTRLYESLGDGIARAAVASCLSELVEQARQHDGVLIKTIGDEILCTFESADAAILSAWLMQETLSRETSVGKPRLTVRVGVHFGYLLPERGDVYGDAVNTAARVAGLAKPEQILTTHQTLDGLRPGLRSSARFVERVAVRGKSEELDLFEILWHGDSATRVIPGWSPPEPAGRTLRLSYCGSDMSVDHGHRSISIGRGSENDLVLDDVVVSRLHARVELRRDKFYLVDLSTNGTFVVQDSGQSTHIKRDELLLQGCGDISPGRPASTDGDRAIHFEITSIGPSLDS